MNAITIRQSIDTSHVPAAVIAAYRSYAAAEQRVSWVRGETRGAKQAATRRWNAFSRLCADAGLAVQPTFGLLTAAEANRCL